MFTLHKNVTLTVRQCVRFTMDTRGISDLTLNLPGVVVGLCRVDCSQIGGDRLIPRVRSQLKVSRSIGYSPLLLLSGQFTVVLRDMGTALFGQGVCSTISLYAPAETLPCT